MMGPMFDFDTVDANKDGKITADEFKAHRVAEMKAVDADGDGKITAEELTAMHMKAAEARAKAMAPQMLERMDVDGDGEAIDPAARYRLDPEHGPRRMREARGRDEAATGRGLLALAVDAEPEGEDLASLADNVRIQA